MDSDLERARILPERERSTASKFRYRDRRTRIQIGGGGKFTRKSETKIVIWKLDPYITCLNSLSTYCILIIYFSKLLASSGLMLHLKHTQELQSFSVTVLSKNKTAQVQSKQVSRLYHNFKIGAQYLQFNTFSLSRDLAHLRKLCCLFVTYTVYRKREIYSRYRYKYNFIKFSYSLYRRDRLFLEL